MLKNAVNVSIYNLLNDARDSNHLGFLVNADSMTDDAIVVVITNNMLYNNSDLESIYGMLDNPKVLQSVCRTFVKYRTDPSKREILDNMSVVDERTKKLNNDLDVYYARFGNQEINYKK